MALLVSFFFFFFFVNARSFVRTCAGSTNHHMTPKAMPSRSFAEKDVEQRRQRREESGESDIIFKSPVHSSLVKRSAPVARCRFEKLK